MSSVDERIVRLDMENQGFEKGAAESIKTLDLLKSALDLTGAGKSLLNLQSIGEKFSLASMASSIETISDRFTLMGSIAYNALDRIATKVVDTGEKMVKSLTVDNIAAGWQKYADKTTSVATLVSQGYDMSVVEDQLARLNWYTDETSYNFTDMVSNIAKFTAAGQDLETSVTAMEGIANWAALSGQNATTASRAMYQLSQALSAGTMRKQDYMSIQNANMDTQEFRQKALDAAVALGTLKKNADDTYESLVANGKVESFTIGQFADHLTQDAWFTSDVMMKVYQDYAAAVDQIYEYTLENADVNTTSQAMERLGDQVDEFGLKAFKAAQEAKTFSDVMDATKDAVSTAWMNIFDKIFGNYEEQRVMWTDLANTLWDVFAGPLSNLLDYITAWNELGGRNDLLDSIHNLWYAANDLFDAFSEGFHRIFPVIEDDDERIQSMGETIKSVTASIKAFTERITLSEELTENISRTFAGVAAVIDIVRMGIVAFVKAVSTMVGKLIPAGAGLVSFTGNIGDFLVSIRDAIKEGDFFGTFFGKLVDIFDAAHSGITKVITAIKEFINLNFDGFNKSSEKVKESFGWLGTLGSIASSIIDKLTPIFSALAKVFGNFFKMLGDAISNFDPQKLLALINAGVLTKVLNSSDGVLGTLQSFIGTLKGTFSSVTDIKGKISDLFGGVKTTLEEFTKSLKSDTLLKIAASIGILTLSIMALSGIDQAKLSSSLTAVGVMFAELIATLKIFSSSFDKKGLKNLDHVSKSLTTFSAAIVILSAAVVKLAKLDWDELKIGLTGLAVSAGVMVTAMIALSKFSDKIKTSGTSMLLFAASLVVLAQAVKQLGALDPATLLTGLAGVAALFAEISIFSATMQGNKGFTSAAVGITIVSSAMLIFAKAVEKLGSMDTSVLGKGMISIAEALIAFAMAMNLMESSGVMSKAASILVVSTALVVLSNAIEKIGSMPISELGKALITIGASISVLALALSTMSSTSLASSAAILVVVGALALLTPVLKKLGSMSITELGKALLALVGVFAVFGGAAMLLSPMIPVMFALGGAMTLLGVSVLALGAGITMLSVGLAALSVSATTASVGFSAIISAIVGAIPLLLEQVGYGIVAILDVIANSATALAETAGTLISAFTGVIIDHAPELVDAALVLITSFLGGIAANIYQITDSAVDIIINFLRAIESRSSDILDTAISVLVTFADGLVLKSVYLVNAALEIVSDFIEALGQGFYDMFPELVQDVINLAGNIVLGIIYALEDGLTAIKNTIKKLCSSVVGWFKEFFGIASPSKVMRDEIGNYIVEGVAEGMDNHKSLLNSVKGIGKAVLGGLQSFFKIQSPSRLMRDEVGNYIVEGIAEGIEENMTAEEAAAKKAQNIINAFKTELDKFDLDMSTADLEFSLWEKTTGLNASDDEKKLAQMGLAANKYQYQLEKVTLAQAEYQTTMENFGEYAEETQQAYNKLLNAQIALADLANQMNDLQTQMTEMQLEANTVSQVAIDKYYDYLRDNTELLLKGGMTIEQIKEAAVANSGYDPDSKAMTDTVKNSVASAMTAVTDGYKESADSTFGALTGDFTDWGSAYAKAMGTGIQNDTKAVMSATKEMVLRLEDTIREEQPAWEAAASYLIDGFIVGIHKNTQRAVEEAERMATLAFAAAMAKFGIASPSKKFAWLGEMDAVGLAKGIHDNAYLAADASSSMAEETLSIMGEALRRVSETIDDNVDFQPTIRPVLDMEQLKRDSSQINGVLAGSAGLRLPATISRVGMAARNARRVAPEELSNTDVQPTGTTSYNFTQNNYSPKSLSRQEIYRQTKNQFAALKGRVNG